MNLCELFSSGLLSQPHFSQKLCLSPGPIQCLSTPSSVASALERARSLTQADGWFACPAAVSFAGTVLRATPEGEALLAGVDEGVTHGWQVQGPNVGVYGRLWLLAVVGWVIRAKTKLGLRNLGSEDAADTFEGPLFHSVPV